MTFTVEHKKSKECSGEISIFLDSKGLEELVRQIEILRANGGHVHLMTPSWAGNELTEVSQSGGDIINHLKIVLIDGVPRHTNLG